VIEAEADDLVIKDGACLRGEVRGWREIAAGGGADHRHLSARAHPYRRKADSGRPGGEAPALGLSTTLERAGFTLGRLKTGTPPRLDGRTFDWPSLQNAPGDDPPEPFSMLTARIDTPQIECGITRTVAATHRDIRRQCASFAGCIPVRSRAGAALLPVDRRQDRQVRRTRRSSDLSWSERPRRSHRLSERDSTSLPEEVQHALVATIPGLEKAQFFIIRPAMPSNMIMSIARAEPTLETKRLPGYSWPGDHGTTGLREAAAQGLLGRVSCGGWPVARGNHLDRAQAYIGVMSDDLVTRELPSLSHVYVTRGVYACNCAR